MNEEPVTRATVRALVERETNELKSAAAYGGNPYQVALDHQDSLAIMTDGMAAEEKTLFLSLYAEEKNAANQAMENEAAKNVAERAATSATAAALLPAVLGLIAFIMTMVFLFKR